MVRKLGTYRLHEFVLVDFSRARREALYRLGCEVRGEHYYRVLEADLFALAVGERSLVEDLIEKVHHVDVSLLAFVEQDDGVGPAADGLGEHSALAVADVARRRADETRDCVLFLEFAHVYRYYAAAVAEEQLREREAGLRLSDAGGACEQEYAKRAVGRHEPRRRGLHGARDGAQCRVLSLDAFAEKLVELLRDGGLVARHAPRRDSGPVGYDLSDDLGGYFDGDEAAFLVQRFVPRLRLFEFAAQRLFVLRGLRLGRGFALFGFALSFRGFVLFHKLRRVEHRAAARDKLFGGAFFVLPLDFQARLLGGVLRYLGFELGEPLFVYLCSV